MFRGHAFIAAPNATISLITEEFLDNCVQQVGFLGRGKRERTRISDALHQAMKDYVSA